MLGPDLGATSGSSRRRLHSTRLSRTPRRHRNPAGRQRTRRHVRGRERGRDQAVSSFKGAPRAARLRRVPAYATTGEDLAQQQKAGALCVRGNSPHHAAAVRLSAKALGGRRGTGSRPLAAPLSAATPVCAASLLTDRVVRIAGPLTSTCGHDAQR